jgi:hypothetical protein
MTWIAHYPTGKGNSITPGVIDGRPSTAFSLERKHEGFQEEKEGTVTNINETVIGYIAAWNEGDPTRRRAIIARTWADDGHYLDAHRDSTGHQAIDAMIAAVQQQFAGYRFRLSSGIEAHHDRVRFSWTAGGTPDAPLFFGGTDFAVLANDGRLKMVTGFTDAMPSAA